jgi:hypothetical protein
MVDSLKVLDPNRPIREAEVELATPTSALPFKDDIRQAGWHVRGGGCWLGSTWTAGGSVPILPSRPEHIVRRSA